MRKSLLLFTLLTISSTTLPSLAYNDPGGIISIGVGGSKASMKSVKTVSGTIKPPSFKLAPVYNAELSYRFNSFFRAGIDAQYRLIRMSTPNSFSGTTKVILPSAPTPITADVTLNPSPISAKSLNVLLNGYLEWDNYTRFTPYVMAGVGFGNITLSEKVAGTSSQPANTEFKTSVKASQSGMCFNFGAGVQIQLAYNMGIDLTYRHVRIGKLSMPNYLKAVPGVSSVVPNKSIVLNAQEFLMSFYMLLG